MKRERKILIIEDDQFIRDLYARKLKNFGYKVKAVASAEDGKKMIEKEKFDMVLLDIMLPGENGLVMLKDFKEIDGTQKINFVLLTNIGQETIIKQGLQLGAKGYLIKSSYSPQEVVEEINSYFKN